MNKKNMEGFLQLRKNSSSQKNTEKKKEEEEGCLLSSYSFVNIGKCTFPCPYLKMKNKYHLSLSFSKN